MVDADLFDRSAGRPHPEFDACSLESRARRARSAGEPILIPQNNFSICPDVYIKGQGLSLENTGTQNSCNDIAPYVTGNRWKDVDMNVTPDVDPQMDRSDRRDELCSRDVWLLADILRIQTQKEMSHGCIAGNHQVGDERPVDLTHVKQFLDDLINGR